MEIDPYLERIGYSGSRSPTVETLRQLHRAHVLSVPFEDLDIHLGYPIDLSLPSFYDKIVKRRRGGFCYELNGLFGWLLAQLGFKVVTLSGRFYRSASVEGRPDDVGPEFDHILLLIELEEQLIADVGFGDSFLEPLWLDSGRENVQHGKSYRFTDSDVGKVVQRKHKSDWEPMYIFSLTPRRLAEFSAACHYQQTAPETFFMQHAVCSLATTNGRITLLDNRLIMTTGEQREKQTIESEEEYRTLLKTHFGVELGEDEQVDRLMVPRPSSIFIDQIF